MRTSEQITQWLKENGLYIKFRNNYNRAPHSLTLAEFLQEMPSKHIILSAFVWHDMPEGSAFWNIVNKNYLKWMTMKDEFCDKADRCRNFCPYICDETCHFVEKKGEQS